MNASRSDGDGILQLAARVLPSVFPPNKMWECELPKEPRTVTRNVDIL